MRLNICLVIILVINYYVERDSEKVFWKWNELQVNKS